MLYQYYKSGMKKIKTIFKVIHITKILYWAPCNVCFFYHVLRHTLMLCSTFIITLTGIILFDT